MLTADGYAVSANTADILTSFIDGAGHNNIILINVAGNSITVSFNSINPKELPTVTAADNGKSLYVVDGAWAAQAGPAAVTEQTVAEWGFTKNTGTYSKPDSGIPKSDLTQAVQTSLGKADTALQQHQSLSGYATETWVNQRIAAIPDELPSGGSAGDFLCKTASGVAWQTIPSAESNSFGGGN